MDRLRHFTGGQSVMTDNPAAIADLGFTLILLCA